MLEDADGVLYQEIRIWRRLKDKQAIRYFCLMNLGTGRYAVQQADYFQLPAGKASHEAAKRVLEDQAMWHAELFIDISPLERCEWFDTLPAAIAAFEAERESTE